MSQADPNSFPVITVDQMNYLARQFANACVPGMTLYLQGELGAGKTTFVRGFLQGLGHTNLVKSPTYHWVEPYEFSGFSIFHFDFYRLETPSAVQDIGLQDYFLRDAICLIEWPEKAVSYLPSPDVVIRIEYQKDASRLVHMDALSELGKKCLQRYFDA